MLRRARQSVYWPDINAEVEQKRRQCQVCEVNAPSSPAEPLLPTPPPKYPFQQAVVDLFQLAGQMYVAYADRLTGWLEVEHLPTSSTSTRLVSTFRRWFRRFGIPEVLSCDGGTNLVSEENRTFLSAWRVQLRVSSAHYPQSNGRAEAAVKSAKRLPSGNTGHGGSLDSDAAATAILQYLNTPLQDTGISPAQLLMGRQLRDSVPAATKRYRVSERWARMLRDRERAVARTGADMSAGFDRTAHDLTPLALGQQVRLQNQETGRRDRVGTVVDAPAPRQYPVRLHGSGRASLGNRRHLRPSVIDAGQPAPPGREDAARGAVAEGVRGEGPPLPPQPPARPQRTRRAPEHLADYIL
ncbi:hypothetical protein GWK47_045094 [Chionoecetes opilio]|uniref:Integrase catalytic domain-containing protein n=1 Tax=Chionoecetes opilio TaxID=41210 RepID=A0A8J5CXE6_CHIOP|nr:hypothetical protein GWK47_045094 [Chionoecetes opilio]